MTATLRTLIRDTAAQSWRARAVCRDHDPELFFPVERGAARPEKVARAQAICRSCPVIAECRKEGAAVSRHGVWGGVDRETEPAPMRSAQTPVGDDFTRRLAALLEAGEQFTVLDFPARVQATAAQRLRAADVRGLVRLVGTRNHPIKGHGARLSVYKAVTRR